MKLSLSILMSFLIFREFHPFSRVAGGSRADRGTVCAIQGVGESNLPVGGLSRPQPATQAEFCKILVKPRVRSLLVYGIMVYSPLWYDLIKAIVRSLRYGFRRGIHHETATRDTS